MRLLLLPKLYSYLNILLVSISHLTVHPSFKVLYHNYLFLFITYKMAGEYIYLHTSKEFL